MTSKNAKYGIGQLVHHKRFDYRGVVIDVDPNFSGTDEWYNQMAKSEPPKDKPWYHILVDGRDVQTYVAERNLEPDETGGPIHHPHVDVIFDELGDNGYISRAKSN